MERLFLFLGTLKNQGFTASCSHLPSRWGKGDGSQLTVSTALWRGGLENLVVWMVPLRVCLSCFAESSERCEGGQDSGCCSWQEMGCSFPFCSHPQVAHYLKTHSSFRQQLRHCHFQKLWHRVCGSLTVFFYFFHPFGIFFSLLPPNLRVTSERFPSEA